MGTIINLRFILLSLLFLFATSAVSAKPISIQQIPDDLKPWQDWVLYGEEEIRCPFLYQNIKTRRCAWPTVLKLDLQSSQGSFSQQWHAYTDSFLTLPGDAKHWPQTVKVDGSDAIVVTRNGRPGVWVSAGKHSLSGRFHWSSMPESLLVPADTGLIDLKINNNVIPLPDIDASGKLWLRERDTGKAGKDKDGDHLDIQVFRRVTDLIPQQVTTRLVINVSGSQREVVVGKALLDDFIPLRLDSRLPARLEPGGQLRLQVRPGQWTINLTARASGEVKQSSPGANLSPWPDEEIWSFDAQNHLRLIEIEGVPAVDPRQTNLPPDWRQFPAYKLGPTSSMVYKQIRRGDPDPAPDQLSLSRELWLDHDGGGFTVKDSIKGSMTQQWRLEAGDELQLGRAVVDGQPQFITSLPGKTSRGVEVRHGTIQLDADSRMAGDIDTFPAVGWQHDFQSARANLHLPPGWDVFSVRGTDNVPHSWLQRWTLLDLFVVLIIGISAARMWNLAYGAIALVTVTVLWHEPLAPTYIFLNLLAAIALIRVLPKGVFASIVRTYRSLSLVALVLIAVPFMVHEIRTGIYPQLEIPGQVQTHREDYATPMSTTPMSTEELHGLREKGGVVAKRAIGKLYNDYDAIGEGVLSSNVPLSRIDPQANIQTGPGLPQWRWRSVLLSWNGPVEQHQQVNVIFINPVTNLILSFLRVALLVVFSACLFGINYRKGKGFSFNAKTLMPIILVVMLLPIGSQESHAGTIPDENILKELKTRLTAAPDCLPDCAQSPVMSMHIAEHEMTLQVDVHAVENVAVPLPAHVKQWFPQQVTLDGKQPEGLYRTPAGELWINVAKGQHRVVLVGDMPERNSFTLPMPLTPHRVVVQAEGWVVDGVHEDGVPDRQLQLTRLQANDKPQQRDTLEPGVFPGFATVNRTLRLGLDWQIETWVRRTSPTGNAIVMEFPLLEGESVITENVRVENGRVLVSMSPGQSDMFWLSSLEKRDTLTLAATRTTEWTEVWRADISPIWHAELDGIPVVHHQDREGKWLPEWRPYPGETASLLITRPQGVEGQTLTIDNSQLTIKPGKRATDTSLTLSLRSSQGGQHTVTLPESVELQSVSINGSEQPVRQEGRKVTLPIVPGKQQVTMQWRDSRPLSMRYRTAAMDLGMASVNHRINLQLGRDRWVLLTGGPRLGPAVLYWSVLIVIVLIAVILGRIKLTPLRTWHWLLLGIGLSQVSVIIGLIVVGWLLALGGRCRLPANVSNGNFNGLQIVIAGLTVIALSLLVFAIEQGLLGYPDMIVAGNGSSAYNMNWYQDRTTSIPDSAWVLAVPIFVYRILMLAWALWLAFAVLRWLKWGWGCYSTNGLWRKKAKIIKDGVKLEK